MVKQNLETIYHLKNVNIIIENTEKIMNKYHYIKMRKAYADIIKEWRYDGYMKEIFMDPYYENVNSKTGIMNGPGKCDGYAVLDSAQIIGLFECYIKEKGIIEIGLALNPEFVGKGLSREFILQGIDFIKKAYDYRKPYIQLTVEINNKSAFYAYLKAGFIEDSRDNDEVLMKYYLN